MKKGYMKTLMLLIVSTLLYGCATYHEQQIPTTNSLFQPHPFEANRYQAKVDNFVAVLDASSSMGNSYNGQSKIKIARDFLSALNQSLPEVDLNAELRTFGHYSHVSHDDTTLFYGLKQYSTAEFAAALSEVNHAGGTTPMKDAIRAATNDLSSTQGKSAIVIVTDGEDTEGYTTRAVEEMNAALGSNVCLYTVLVGNSANGAQLLNQISSAAGCGFSARADDLRTHGNMADFVNKVFLTGVVAAPVEGDRDGDGVKDSADRCPNTPAGANVNAQGCWILGGILFDTDKSTIKANYYSEVNEVAAILASNPALSVEIQGHTDSVGRAAYNMKLSERRAKAVMDYLLSKGTDPRRLTTRGFGLTMPTVSNDTSEGRAKNRRVELKPTAQ